jgi:hypothetical protein
MPDFRAAPLDAVNHRLHLLRKARMSARNGRPNSCLSEGEHRFISGYLKLPIIGSEQKLVLGVWIPSQKAHARRSATMRYAVILL